MRYMKNPYNVFDVVYIHILFSSVHLSRCYLEADKHTAFLSPFPRKLSFAQIWNIRPPFWIFSKANPSREWLLLYWQMGQVFHEPYSHPKCSTQLDSCIVKHLFAVFCFSCNQGGAPVPFLSGPWRRLGKSDPLHAMEAHGGEEV
jgi:hypothetical protein